VRKDLERIEVPDEHEARVRSWDVVRTAFEEREPARPARPWKPLVVLVAAAAVLAAVVSPPGRSVVDSLREAIGVESAEPALFSLPAPGRLLVSGESSAWVVRPDGSRRLLGDYAGASWSPFGNFVVATRENELAALEPDGDVRWRLARRDVSLVRWGGTLTDTRIAYLSGATLRVVAGNGERDRELARNVRAVAPAWRPGEAHVLAWVAGRQVVVADADRGRVLTRFQAPERTVRLEWSRDGQRLLVQARRSLRVHAADGSVRLDLLGRGAAPIAHAAFGPGGTSLAFVQTAGGQSNVWVIPRLAPDASAARRVFSGAGIFDGLAWSPNGRWLLVAWHDADQWVFVRDGRTPRIAAVSNVSAQFDGSFPRIEGWCCAR
jgi:WD40 repeat protein